VFALAVAQTQRVACPKPTVAVAPHEPYVTRGPTEIVVGLYIQGGPFIPGCHQEPRGPDAGTVTVSAHGRVVEHETLRSAGRLFVLRVAPGRYTVAAPGSLRRQSVVLTVHQGQTVREDLFADVP